MTLSTKSQTNLFAETSYPLDGYSLSLQEVLIAARGMHQKTYLLSEAAQQRMQATIAETESKLAIELKDRDVARGRTDHLERELTSAKEQLAEMKKTAARAVRYQGVRRAVLGWQVRCGVALLTMHGSPHEHGHARGSSARSLLMG